MKIFDNFKELLLNQGRTKLTRGDIFENLDVPLDLAMIKIVDREIDTKYNEFVNKYMTLNKNRGIRQQIHADLFKRMIEFDVRLIKKDDEKEPKLGSVNFPNKRMYLRDSEDSLNYVLMLASSMHLKDDLYGFVKKDEYGKLENEKFTRSYAKVLVKRYFNEKLSTDLEEELAIELEARLGHKEMMNIFFHGNYEDLEKLYLNTYEGKTKDDLKYILNGEFQWDMEGIDRDYSLRLREIRQVKEKEDPLAKTYLIRKNY